MVAVVSVADGLAEYVDNLRALLRLDQARWSLVVERQVLSRVLPRLSGSRAKLESPLWSLLILCLDGHDAPTPELTEENWEKARQAAADSKAFSRPGRAVYPHAAVEVAMLMTVLREAGVYPPPVLRHDGKE